MEYLIPVVLLFITWVVRGWIEDGRAADASDEQKEKVFAQAVQRFKWECSRGGK